jgi:hypothetical protein
MRPVPPDTGEPAARPVDACPSARAATGILSGKVRPAGSHAHSHPCHGSGGSMQLGRLEWPGENRLKVRLAQRSACRA